jgi:RNA polymerase sigma-70 factor (ECF subfamily)
VEDAGRRTSRGLEADGQLVARARAGDHRAFRSLVERHQQSALLLARGMLRHEEDARDVVQDAFVRVHKGLDAFQGTSAFFTWLYRIVTNLAIDLERRPHRTEVVGLHPEHRGIGAPLVARLEGTDPLRLVSRRQLAERIDTALAALPADQRAVIVMREIDGMSCDEIASAMHVPRRTINSRIVHARRKLRRALASSWLEHAGVTTQAR